MMIKNLLFLLFFAFSLFCTGQELTPKQIEKFNQHFFEAQRLKLTDLFDKALSEYKKCADIDPTNAVVQFEISGLYFVKKEYYTAVGYANEAVKLDPENKWYRVRVIETLMVLNRRDEVAKHQLYLANAYPQRLDYKTNLLNSYLALADYNNAIIVLNSIEAQQGIAQNTSTQKRDLYILKRDFEKAQSEMEKLAQHYPKNIEYMGLLAQHYQMYGPQEKVLPLYKKMLEIAPQDPRAHLDLAKYYQAQNNFEESSQHLIVALSSPELPFELKVNVLMSFYESSKADSNIRVLGYQLLDSVVKVHPTQNKIYAIYANFLLRDNHPLKSLNYLRKSRNLGATQKQVLEQIVLLDSENNQMDSLLKDADYLVELYPNQPLGYLMKGLALSQTNNAAEAIETLEYGLLYSGNDQQLKEQFYLYLAEANHLNKTYVQSDNYFEKALEINPKNSLTLNNYAYYLALRKQRLNQALEMTKICNKLDPLNPGYLDTWAWVLYAQGDFKNALLKIEDAIELTQNIPAHLLEHKGDILFKLDRHTEALNFWKQALKANTNNATLVQKIKTQKLIETP